MSYRDLFMQDNVWAMEKFQLAVERIAQISKEESVPEKYRDFFGKTSEFILYVCKLLEMSEFDGIRSLNVEELSKINEGLFADISCAGYDKSYANPEYCNNYFDDEYAVYLCYLYAKVRNMIPYAVTYRIKEVTIYMELFIEVYNIFESEGLSEKEVKEAIYWFESDYTDVFYEDTIRSQLDLDMNFYYRLVTEENLDDNRYLYYYGKYVSDNEIRLAEYIRTLPEEKIKSMADTFTDGFKRGFELAKKDMSKKDRVELRYPLGFERVVREAVNNFKKMGLKVIIRPASISGASVNKQYEYDHKFDEGLFLDKAYCDRKLSVARVTFEKYKKEAALKAGPAVIESFGENPFVPKNSVHSIKLDEKQRKLSAAFSNSYVQVYYDYIKGDETSFTIIAYPVPEIGDHFEEIFEETIEINNLDEKLYTRIQQQIIDILDTAEYVAVRGKGKNKTDMTVKLASLHDKEKETLFENCVADVNIPVGEVFTSPKLNGTNGILNVSRVYLNGLEYKDLTITFENGMIKKYSCTNYESEEKSKEFIKENLLNNRETLPIGEFAIGTNTTAYVMANKYDIVYKLPILIVEKMGPHFAVGDTCYSFEEDNMTYNPDGKAIVARENEISALRNEKPEEAYFGIHTDITIPYDEIGEISAIREDGEEICIIRDGRFVAEGTEELNRPFENN